MKRHQNTNSAKSGRRPRSILTSMAIVFVMTGLLFLTINYRAFKNVNNETREFDLLSAKIQGISDENLRLQDEIHSLKTDSATIMREAQRLGIIGRSPSPVQQFSVPKK